MLSLYRESIGEPMRIYRGFIKCIHSSRLAYSFLVFLSLIFFPQGIPAADQDIVQKDGAVRAILDNGLRVVIVQNPLAPVVTAVMSYIAGSSESPEGFPGTAHAQEHMLFRGSPGLSAGQLANISAAMGGVFNASTQQNVTSYYFTVPAEDLEVALRIEAIRMQGVDNNEDLWGLERGAIEQEIDRNFSSPEYVLFIRILEEMFKDTPYEHTGLGTRDSLDKTTGAMLKKFYDAWYAPNNAILFIVGNVQPQEALEKVKRNFSNIPAKDLPHRPEVHLKPVAPHTIRLATDKPDGVVMLSFRMPGYDSPDYAAAQVLEDVLASRRGNLYALVPQGKALDTDFQMLTLPKAGLGYAVASFTKGSDSQQLLNEMERILSLVKKNGIPIDMVEAAKRHKAAQAEFRKNSISGLAMAWSDALAVKGRASVDDEVNAIRQVSVEDVNRVARAYIDLGRSITGILTPEFSDNPVAPGVSGNLESFTPKPSSPVTLPDWALSSLNRLSIPVSTLKPVVSMLPNGIKLIVQSESVSNTVSVYGRVKNNPYLETPPGKEGVHDMLEKLFDFGTASLNREDFLKACDDISAEVSAGTDFSLRVLQDQFERGVQLLADNQLRPALPEKAFDTMRGQDVKATASRLKSSGYLAERAVITALLPKNDPGLRQTTPATLSSLTIQDVRDYYHTVFRPDLTTIVVIGKITPEQARKTIEKYFGSWKSPEGPKPETEFPPISLNGPSLTVVPNASRVQDMVTLTQTLGLNRSNPDYYALQLGNRILGGSFYATRLFRDLRENAGLVYNVSTSFDMTLTRGFYTVQYGCEPANAGKARAIIEQNLKDMQTNPVSAEELQRAKVLLLREIPLSESSVDRIGPAFIRRTELKLPLDEPIRAAQRYIQLTSDDIRAAFARWIRVGDIIQVMEGPNR